ncbi:hypothetical protein ACFVIN_01495 [Streptomyces prasinus]|uniref:hypothetical protein n=1 Tax=Streptomyces prasinus TaxID=67345 RepID=UPI00363C71A5
MLVIEVKRHGQGTEYFEPWIDEHEDGCTYHFHWDDISDEGVGALSDVITQQVRQLWRPRPPGAPAGRRIPVIMERRILMEGRDTVAVYDLPECIIYMVRADLISARGAALITRRQSELTTRWMRVSGRGRGRQLQAV